MPGTGWGHQEGFAEADETVAPLRAAGDPEYELESRSSLPLEIRHGPRGPGRNTSETWRGQGRVSTTVASPAHLPQRPCIPSFVLLACQLCAAVKRTSRPVMWCFVRL